MSTEHKNALTNLALKISKKIVKSVKTGVKNSIEVAGLRISLKIIFLEKLKLKSNLKNCIEDTLLKFSQVMTFLIFASTNFQRVIFQ